MNPHYHALHLAFAMLLVASVFADIFFVRSKTSLAIQPTELAQKWRLRVALMQMFFFTGVLGFGFAMWLPFPESFSKPIFHSKIALALAFMIVAKIRIRREKRLAGPDFFLTRVLAIFVAATAVLGIIAGTFGSL